MFFKSKTEEVLRREIDKLIDQHKTFRSRIRSGTIVFVSNDTNTGTLLSKLAEECSQTIEIVKVSSCPKAKDIIEKIGPDNVKAVLIDAEMIDDNANGGSLPHWLGKNHSDVPIWAYNCSEKKREVIMRCNSRVGILNKNINLITQLDTVGFPSEK